MSKPLSYEDIFKEMDKDGSGSLTVSEVTEMLHKIGYEETDERIKTMFGFIDASDDHTISLQEFLAALGALPAEEHKEANMRRCFREFDKDGSGSIDRSELRNAMREYNCEISEEEIDRLLQIVDKDESGSINYEEFIAQVFGKISNIT